MESLAQITLITPMFVDFKNPNPLRQVKNLIGAYLYFSVLLHRVDFSQNVQVLIVLRELIQWFPSPDFSSSYLPTTVIE